MVRVPEGPRSTSRLRNSLPDSEVVAHGSAHLARHDRRCGEDSRRRHEVTFQYIAGHLFPRATSAKKPLNYRVGRDSQIPGAIIVDPRNAQPTADHTFIVALDSDDPDSAAGWTLIRERSVINGNPGRTPSASRLPKVIRFPGARSTPPTVRTRCICNGFYFNVERSGGECGDSVLAPTAIRAGEYEAVDVRQYNGSSVRA